MSLIKTVNLTKIYMNGAESIPVFENVNISFEEGEIIALTGPSGVGKSTFLQIIGTLDSPTSGYFLIDEENLTSLDDEGLSDFRNKSIGFVFQFHHLLPEFTALENVSMPGLIAGYSKSEVEGKGKKLLEEVGLGHRIYHRPSELSGGERQRVAVVRALMNNPRIVLADEPTGNLDPENAKILMQIIKSLNNKHNQTFIIATHSKEIASIADTIYEIKNKQIRKCKVA